MKKFSLALAIILCALAPAFAGEPLAMGGGAPSADVKMLSVDGKEVSIKDVMGAKGTLVIFTCNHCPYVKAWEQRTVALANEFAGQGVGVIAINSNDPSKNASDSLDEMKARAARLAMKYPYVVDKGSVVAKAFGASRTPEYFLFDAAGKLVYHGTIDDNHEDASKVEKTWLKDALAAVVAGNAVAEPKSKALGCSIKFYS